MTINQPENTNIVGRPAAESAAQRTRFTFLILALVQGTLIFTITLVLVPLPLIGRELGVGAADLLLISVGYGLPYSGLLLFGGRLVDRFGGRKIFTIGVTLFGLAAIGAAFSTSFETLVAMRFSQGIGAALTAPAAVAILRALFPTPSAFDKAMATWGGVSVLGGTLAPVIAGFVVNWLSWRWMFVVPVAVSLLALAATRSLIPTDQVDGVGHRPGLDPVGALLATAGISIGSYGLVVSGDQPWSSPTVFVPLAAGLLLLIAFVCVERRVRDPLLPLGFLAQPQRLAGLAGMFLAAAGSGLVLFPLSFFFQQQWGWSPLMTAIGHIPFTVVLIAASRIAGPLVGRFGAAPVTIVGLVMNVMGFAWLAAIQHDSSFALGLLPALILLPAGMSLIFAGSAVLSTTAVAPREIGLAGGVMNTAMEMGPTVGLAAFMSVAATRADVVSGYAWAFGTAAIVLFAVALAMALQLRRSR